MTTLTAGQSASFTIDAGQSLSIVSSANNEGSVTLAPTVPADVSDAGKFPIGPPAMTKTFGPYASPVAATVACTVGSIAYTLAGNPLVRAVTDAVTGKTLQLAAGARYPLSDMFSSMAGATMPFSIGGMATDAYATHTWSLTAVYPFAWDAVQFAIIHGHNATAGICQGMRLIAAVSDTMMTDGIPVIGGTGYNSTAVDNEPINPGFAAVTWGGKAGESVAPALADPGSNRFSYGEWSDILRMPSVARVDGGVGKIFTFRHYSATATAVPYSTPRNATPYKAWTEAEAAAAGVPYAYSLSLRKLATDGVGTPSNFVSASRDNGWATILTRFYNKGTPVPTVLWVGDSRIGTIAPSETTYTGCETLPNLVQSLLAVSNPHAVLNYGASGWSTKQYQFTGKNVISIARPKVAVYMVWSSNDGVSLNYDATRINGFKARALEFINECLRNGAIPVLIGTFPAGAALTGTQLANAIELDSWIASTGYPFILPMETLGVASNWTWIGGNPGVNTADGSHPLLVGRASLATAVSSVISALM